VVSFPVKTLGGKSKGMPANYERILYNLIRGKDWQVTKLLFETELVFVIYKPEFRSTWSTLVNPSSYWSEGY